MRRVFGHAARVKTMMMAKTGQLTQGFQYQMHLKALGLPVESERQDVISPTEFFSLVGEFENYAKPFRDAIASDADTMARISKNYEDGSQLKASSHSPSGSGCLLMLIGFVSLPLIVGTVLKLVH